MKFLLKLTAAMGMLLFCHSHLYAQELHPVGTEEKIDRKKVKITYVHGFQPVDTTHGKWLKSLVFLKSAYTKNNGSAVKDTAVGTAFLLSDGNKLYLVAAKHIVAPPRGGKSGQAPNDTITVNYRNYSHFTSEIVFNLAGLAGKGAKHPAVALADDEKNIAIISLQKKEYKAFADSLLAQGCKPVPVNLLDTTNNHHANEELWKFGRSKIGKHESVGGEICFIRDYDLAMAFFTINKVMLTEGISGSIAVGNDKLVGVMSDGTETAPYVAGQPLHWISIPAKFTKASYIIACLRKLQHTEDSADFNR